MNFYRSAAGFSNRWVAIGIILLILVVSVTTPVYGETFFDELDDESSDEIAMEKTELESRESSHRIDEIKKKLAELREARQKNAMKSRSINAGSQNQSAEQGSLFDQLSESGSDNVVVMPILEESIKEDGGEPSSLSVDMDTSGGESVKALMTEEDYAKMVDGWELPGKSCLSKTTPEYLYRKHVAVISFDINDRKAAVDLPFIEREFPKALLGFMDQERFILKDATHKRLLVESDLSGGYDILPIEKQIVALAKELDVQFIVAGKIVDLSLYEGDRDIGRLFRGLPHLGVVDPKQIFRKVDGDGRQLVVEVRLYDGLNGTLVHQQIFPTAIRGEYLQASNVAMRHSSFLKKGALGEAAKEMLKLQANMVAEELTCLPMVATVRRVNKSLVHFNANVESKIIPGDRFKVFRRVIIGTTPLGGYEFDYEYHGHLTVTRVGPTKSMGILDRGFSAYELNPGDIVQAW